MTGVLSFLALQASNDIDVSNFKGNRDYWVSLIDANGNISWSETLGGTDLDQAYQVKQSFDGGFILSGFSQSTDGDVTGNQGLADYWIIKLNAPPLPVLELGDDLITCPGDEVSFDISDPDCINCTYLWNDGATEPIRQVFPTDDTRYVVTITDAAGCTIADSVLVDPIPVPTLELGPDTAFCPGSSLELIAGNGSADYLWSTGSTAESIIVNTEGEYIVTVTNAANCSIIDSIFVSQLPPPPVDLGIDRTVCQFEELTLDATDPACFNCSYSWSDDSSITDSVADNLTQC